MLANFMGLSLREVALGLLFVLLAPVVLYYFLRQQSLEVGARRLFRGLADRVGGTWLPPKNETDSLAPGRVHGTLNGRKFTLDRAPLRGMRQSAPTHLVARVHFARSLGLGLQASYGTSRGEKKGDLQLADADLTKMLRPAARDEAGATSLLSNAELSAALLALRAGTQGLRMDDGTLACERPYAADAQELVHYLERMERVARLVDEAQGPQLGTGPSEPS